MNDHLVFKGSWFWDILLCSALNKAHQKCYLGFLWSPCFKWENKQSEAGFKEDHQSTEYTQSRHVKKSLRSQKYLYSNSRKNRLTLCGCKLGSQDQSEEVGGKQTLIVYKDKFVTPQSGEQWKECVNASSITAVSICCFCFLESMPFVLKAMVWFPLRELTFPHWEQSWWDSQSRCANRPGLEYVTQSDPFSQDNLSWAEKQEGGQMAAAELSLRSALPSLSIGFYSCVLNFP